MIPATGIARIAGSGLIDDSGVGLVQGTADPDFDADVAVGGRGVDGGEVDVGAERMQRDDAFFVAFATGDFSTGETARAEGTATFGARFADTLEGLLLGGTVGGTVLELTGNPVGD